MLLKQYLDLITYKVYADLQAEASRTYLSFLWWVIEPIMYMAVFYVVFGLLFKRGDGPEYIPFLLTGLTLWKWFDASVRAGASSIHANSYLMRQINLPKVIFPLIAIAQTTLRSGLVLILLLGFLELAGPGISPTYAALPVLLLVQFLLICACAFALAATVPFIPDISQLIGNVMVLLMFLSGIFFSGKTIPEQYQTYFYMNPMATLLESYRDILLYNAWPDWGRVTVIAVLSAIFLFFITRIIFRLDKVYPKVLP